MSKTKEWRVIGLWQVWDDLPEAPAVTERAPEALLERVAKVFDHRPNERECGRALAFACMHLHDEHRDREVIGHLVVDEAGWEAMLADAGRPADGSRRHAPGAESLLELAVYSLDPIATKAGTGQAWAFGRPYGRDLDDVADTLRRLGDARGLPPAPDLRLRRAVPHK